MSIKVMTAVWEKSEAKGNDRLVLLALADNANDQGECWPSIRYIARKCRIDERTTQRRIRSLEAIGEVFVVKNGGRAAVDGGTRSNKYVIVLYLEGDGGDLPGSGEGARGEGGAGAGGRVAQAPPEPSMNTSIEPPLYPQPGAGDRRHLRRGMRGTGTSPRELRELANMDAAEKESADERDRLVGALPAKYAHLPDIADKKIRETFADDPDRLKASLEVLERVTAS